MSTPATLYESIAKMPAINQHVVVNRFGGPEVLEIVEDEIPQPGPGAVRVRIMRSSEDAANSVHSRLGSGGLRR
jgi:hypothetical protein